MFSSFYYNSTLAEVAKNAAQPRCYQVQKKMHQPPQNFCKYTFPGCCRNDLGSIITELFMFSSFHYNSTLAAAAKNAAQPHCYQVPKNKNASTATKLLQINLMALDQL